MNPDKQRVHDFWNRASCGEELYLAEQDRDGYRAQAAARYALLGMKPWMTLREVYARYLESPGTKAYSVAEARALFADFSQVEIRTVLTHGDLLESGAGHRHRGALLTLARKVWPRWLIRRLFSQYGLFMLVDARR